MFDCAPPKQFVQILALRLRVEEVDSGNSLKIEAMTHPSTVYRPKSKEIQHFSASNTEYGRRANRTMQSIEAARGG
jgi:hypothetical protein